MCRAGFVMGVGTFKTFLGGGGWGLEGLGSARILFPADGKADIFSSWKAAHSEKLH